MNESAAVVIIAKRGRSPGSFGLSCQIPRNKSRISLYCGPSKRDAVPAYTRRDSVAIIDKAIFPRHKTCASWINALAFSRFPYLQPALDNLVDCPFHGNRFYDQSISRDGGYNERKPSGYLTLRSKFDHGLANIAVAAGAILRQGVRAARIVEDNSGVQATLSDGTTLHARLLLGADGSNSQIARWSGLRKSWRHDQYVLCANEDIPYGPRTRVNWQYAMRPESDARLADTRAFMQNVWMPWQQGFLDTLKKALDKDPWSA